MDFNRKRVAMGGGLVYGAVTIVVLGMILITGALAYFAFVNSIPTGLVNSNQSAIISSFAQTGTSALSLLQVLLIVAAAGLVIAGVFTYLAFGRRTLIALFSPEVVAQVLAIVE